MRKIVAIPLIVLTLFVSLGLVVNFCCCGGGSAKNAIVADSGCATCDRTLEQGCQEKQDQQGTFRQKTCCDYQQIAFEAGDRSNFSTLSFADVAIETLRFSIHPPILKKTNGGNCPTHETFSSGRDLLVMKQTFLI